MQSGNGIKFVDHGWGKILNNLKELSGTRVQVGVLGSDGGRKHPDSDITVAEVALINEFGSGKAHIPSRPLLRGTFTKSNPMVQEIGRTIASRVVNFMQSASLALDAAGKVAVEALRVQIAKGVSPGNAPRTIKEKGFDHPLLWTGLLWEALSHRVTGSGSFVADDYEPISGGK